jgi:beta-1,4-N-acetylglucosaminyltransferase
LRGVGWLHTRIVFVESVCRVNDLSATGKLLYYVADQVQVQWPELLRR